MGKLFDIPIKTYKKTLLMRIRLFFAKSYLTADISKDDTWYCLSKKLDGKLYFIKMWKDNKSRKINGLKASEIIFD
jgi:hypothetical protein